MSSVWAENIWRKTRVLLSVWFAHMTVYRAEIVIWMLSGVLPLIMMMVWIGKSQALGGAVHGFTAVDFATYFLSAWFTRQMLAVWVAWEMDEAIRQGTMSTKLIRPIDPFWEFFSRHVAERFVRLPFVIGIVAVGALLVPGTRLVQNAESLALYLMAVFLAFLLRFFISYCIGLACFWFESATALDDLYFILFEMCSGSFAPLAFYPSSIRAIINWTPFPYLLYYPVQILTGEISGPAAWRAVGILFLWLMLFAVWYRILWKQGLKKYGAVGA